MIEISVFWFVVLTLGCLWLGGAMVFAILGYVNPTIIPDALCPPSWKDCSGIRGSSLLYLFWFFCFVFAWVCYPVYILYDFLECLIDSHEAKKELRENKTASTGFMGNTLVDTKSVLEKARERKALEQK
jgi:hypothetical protein